MYELNKTQKDSFFKNRFFSRIFISMQWCNANACSWLGGFILLPVYFANLVRSIHPEPYTKWSMIFDNKIYWLFQGFPDQIWQNVLTFFGNCMPHHWSWRSFILYWSDSFKEKFGLSMFPVKMFKIFNKIILVQFSMYGRYCKKPQL